ncbi:hypothetical protein POM88_010047 [Heracleum sosnowskyi]|uniref:Uncharacterized protein n=1 Tax=Heracleum sosnowskyi TaxID=360622 RepID=A0AAD8JB26_9APIA|nr:hypothetical protein POM88_010047 [Heracleum sosnowskyi]
MLITAASVDGGGSGGSVYESDGGCSPVSLECHEGHLDHEPVVGGSGVDLGYKEEELECRNLEVEAEVRKLEETLEYQRMIENQAKQKHLAESIYWQVPLSQRQGNGFCNGAGHVPGETGDEASQKISVTHSNCNDHIIKLNVSSVMRIIKLLDRQFQLTNLNASQGNASVDSRRQSCVINPERDSHVRVESKVQELCSDKLSLKIETQGLQHRDTDYREFSQSHTPTKAASTSKDTIAPRDRSEFRLESQLHVVETDSSEVKNDLLSSDIQIFRYAAPEQYIMSTQTPSAPSAPVATALSPVLL